MAPAQSRTLGLGALAIGSVAGGCLFAMPGGPRGAQTRAQEASGSSLRGNAPATSCRATPSGLSGLAVAGAGLLACQAACARGRPLAAAAAVAVPEATEEPPPPAPFNPAEQIGSGAPIGYFDPLGFCKAGDEDGFRKLRAAEIKHGRVAMMASIGALGQHYLRFPGFETAKGTFSVAATGEGVLGLAVLFAASGVLELAWRENPAKEPGNFGDPFGVKMYDEEMRTKEINNGRVAMISVLGIFAAELATGKDAVSQFGLSAVGVPRARASPAVGIMSLTGTTGAASSARSARVLSATAVAEVPAAVAPEELPPPPPFNPAKQIGAMAPLDYFDPLGFCKVGDEAGFRQMRAAEIKHGRVAMMASIGAIGQHFLRFPGFESAKGTFGAGATGEGVLGMVLIFAASSILELKWRDDPAKEPGNFGDPFGLKMYTEEMRLKEISNGRMAMISVLGIFGAELATGKDAIQQFGL